MRKFDNFELKRRVDEVLYYVWDPIGVRDEPYARGEYEGYVLGVLRLVEENRSVGEISEHLASIIKNSMELSPNKNSCDYTARLLMQHKEAIEKGCA